MPSLMIVDDEPDIRFLLRRMAEQAEWHVAGEATSGEEALLCWRELKPDVIILDHRMPGLSGLETAKRILAEEPDQPIILFTAYRDPALEREAADLNIRGCLSKSDLGVVMSELWACMGYDRITSRRRQKNPGSGP